MEKKLYKTELDKLKERLVAWEREKETNANKMQEFAERAIAVLKAEIRRRETK